MFIWKTADHVRSLIESMTQKYNIELIEGGHSVTFDVSTNSLTIPQIDSFASQRVLDSIELMADMAVSRLIGREDHCYISSSYSHVISQALEYIRCCETLKEEYPGAYWNVRDSLGESMGEVKVIDPKSPTGEVDIHKDDKAMSFAACIAALYSGDELPKEAQEDVKALAVESVIDNVTSCSNTQMVCNIAKEIAIKLGLPEDPREKPDGTPSDRPTLDEILDKAILAGGNGTLNTLEGGSFFTSMTDLCHEKKYEPENPSYFPQSDVVGSFTSLISSSCVQVIARAFASKRKAEIDSNARRGAILSPSQAGFVPTGRRDVWYEKLPEAKGKTYVYIVMDGSSSMRFDSRLLQAKAAITIAAACEISGHRSRIAVFQQTMNLASRTTNQTASEHTVLKDWNERVVGNKDLLKAINWNVAGNGGGTPMIGNARLAKDNLLAQNDASRHILVLLSDGDFHYDDWHVENLCSSCELVTVGIFRNAFFNGKKFNGLPITAMSTNGFKGDISKCLTAGLAQSIYKH